MSSRGDAILISRVSLVVLLAAACGSDADDTTTSPPDLTNPSAGRPMFASDKVENLTALAYVAPSPYVHRDVNHVLVTGQSLAIGAEGDPALSLTQPYDNKMFDTGVMSDGVVINGFVPLAETDPYFGAFNPTETMCSGFANLVTMLSRNAGMRSHDMLMSVNGASGVPYDGLQRDSKFYGWGMWDVKFGRMISDSLRLSHVVRAVVVVHGEADSKTQNEKYLTNLIDWQRDYETDVRALTGQSEQVPMFLTQISTWTKDDVATSITPWQQLAAHVFAPGRVILVGPKYHLPYKDSAHLTNEGYRHMGEDHAKAYRRVVLEGGRWEPVRPKAIRREGAVITVDFFVPVPPLVLDTALVSDPGSFGFEYVEATGKTASITKVELTGPETVRITLAREPTPNVARRLRYAFTGKPMAQGGPTTGPRGNLRDSDRTASRHGYPLYNWSVHFEEAVP